MEQHYIHSAWGLDTRLITSVQRNIHRKRDNFYFYFIMQNI